MVLLERTLLDRLINKNLLNKRALGKPLKNYYRNKQGRG